MTKLCLLLALCVTCPGQNTFDAASVKPVFRPEARGASGVNADQGRVIYTNISLENLLGRAYDGEFEQIAGPGWLDENRYDVTATMPESTTQEQFRLMLRNLLEERFHLVCHFETRELPMFNLVVTRGGPKLRETDSATKVPEGFIQLDKPGLVTTFVSTDGGPRARMTARAQSVSRLAAVLRSQLGARVVDETGLTGMYDWTLEYAPRGADSDFADVSTALQTLGLRVEPSKAPAQVLVIDRAEKTPVEN